MNDLTKPFRFPLRCWVLSLFALCGLLTTVVAATVFRARAEFPTWFCPVFLAGTGTLLVIIACYVGALLRGPVTGFTPCTCTGWLWFVLINRLPLEGHASFYVCSEARLGFKGGLPAIICLGNLSQEPEILLPFVGKFDEPVLLIWSDLLADLSDDTRLEDGVVWERKRKEFASVLPRYQELLRFDERRVYLTGSGFAGAYAWMLA